MAEATVLYEKQDGVALVTLNRPDRMNAHNTQLSVELNAALIEGNNDDEVRAIVVTGAGRAFCAGADLETGGDTFDSTGQERPARNVARIPPWDVNKPIIAAINGAAVGVGLTMPLQYDLRIAAADAKLGFVFVRRGIVPELSSSWILPRLIGVARASDLLLSGRIILGEEAAQIGLVNEAVPREQVLPRALEIAHEFKKAAPVSVAATKRMIWRHLTESDPITAAATEARALGEVGKLPDVREGVESFLEKREPRWTGSPKRDLPEKLS